MNDFMKNVIHVTLEGGPDIYETKGHNAIGECAQ